MELQCITMEINVNSVELPLQTKHATPQSAIEGHRNWMD